MNCYSSIVSFPTQHPHALISLFLHHSASRLLFFLLLLSSSITAQRTYAPHSILQSGNWYQVGADTSGVYKVDLSLLNKLGYAGNSFSANSVRVFGRTGEMLPEAGNAAYSDDLQEIPCRVIGNAAFFYAQGPEKLLKDSAHLGFQLKTNLYTNRTYYYISLDGTGKRMPEQAAFTGFSRTTTEYDDVRLYENDLVNFLGSGKEWYGEEFANAPGKLTSRSFGFNFPGRNTAEPVRVFCEVVARSVNGSSRFSVQLNGGGAISVDIAPTGAGPYDVFARAADIQLSEIMGGSTLQLGINFTPGGFNAQGWLNKIVVHARSALQFGGKEQWHFRDWRSVGTGNTRFEITAAPAGAEIWEVTAPLLPLLIKTSVENGKMVWVNDATRLREYIAFQPGMAPHPVAIGKIVPQDLHASSSVRMIVITAPELVAEAERLAAYHRNRDGLSVLLVTPQQIFNEFSAGIPDPTAIRDFVKMMYDRAAGDTARQPRYLLLFGDASYDYKNRLTNNTNLVPAYQSNHSLDPLATYTSDDFFGFLDNHEDINSGLVNNLLDVGIGRIPAHSREQAAAYVNKVLAYHEKTALGPWRNELSFLADDEDGNQHLNDAEYVSGGLESLNPAFNATKIYLDAFPQQSTTAGSRYPAATQASNNKVFSGTLIWNYSGHGGYTRLAEEVLLDNETAASWRNRDKYPLLITATCDFAPYDNPALPSLGEQVLLQPNAGAIALMTTTRVVFAFSNRTMNYNYIQTAFKRNAQGTYPSLGEAVRGAKNFTYLNSGDIINNRKFTLLGDPALTLAFPQHRIKTTAVNGKPVGATPDTIRALEKINITGEITDIAGNLLPNFEGNLYSIVYDKKKTNTTLGNDAGSIKTNFDSRDQVLYKGVSAVKNGAFSFEFIVPKDIAYAFGEGRISYYAENGQTDAGEAFTRLIVGGGSGNNSNDGEGPAVKAWMNDEKFVNGSITNPTPILLVKLTDSSGINTTGAGIGHDVTAVVDNDVNNPIKLNEFYQADPDTYKKGTIRYQLPPLTPGEHTIAIKAWDVANNSGEYLLRCKVADAEKPILDHVLNYPNPFSTRTTFWFEHNRPYETLQLHIRVFSLSGKLVKSLKSTINTTGNRSCDVEWDGKDDYGSKLARGVYWYILSIRTSDQQSAESVQKLVIL